MSSVPLEFTNSYRSAASAVKGLDPSRIFSEDINPLIEEAQKVSIISKEHLGEAVALLEKLKKKYNELETRKKSYSQDLQDYITKMQRAVRLYLPPLKNAENELKHKIALYHQMEQEQAKQARERVEKAFEREDLEPAVKKARIDELAPLPEKAIHTETASFSERNSTDFEIVDFAKVPDRYKTLDEKKVREAIRMGVREIPGLSIYTRKIAVLKIKDSSS